MKQTKEQGEIDRLRGLMGRVLDRADGAEYELNELKAQIEVLGFIPIPCPSCTRSVLIAWREGREFEIVPLRCIFCGAAWFPAWKEVHIWEQYKQRKEGM